VLTKWPLIVDPTGINKCNFLLKALGGFSASVEKKKAEAVK
jgi:hypothetical protein